MFVKAKPSFSFSLKQQWNDAFAGGVSAAIFYAEYLGLGATMAIALGGQAGAAFGTNIVIGAVLLSCIASLFLSKPILTGPRAASLAVLIFGMKFAADRSMQQEHRSTVALTALSVIVITAAFTQLLGVSTKVQQAVSNCPLALKKGFMYATAVAIAAGASVGMEGCLRVAPLASIVAVAFSLSVALGWLYVCRLPKLPAWFDKLSSFSMMLGVAVASIAYYTAIADRVNRGQCGTLGITGLDTANFAKLPISAQGLGVAYEALPVWIWLSFVVIGLLVGTVTLIESLSTLAENRYGIERTEWPRYIKVNAAINFLAAPLGLSCSSFSAARTSALVDAQAVSNKAGVWHGITLLFFLLSLNSLIGKIPQLAISVALILVAIQMIDEDMTQKAWGNGFAVNANATSVQTSWGFLGVLGTSIGAGFALKFMGIAFSAGAIISLVLCGFAVYLKSRLRSQQSV